MATPLDYLLISPASPYRGGITDSTHQLALALQDQGHQVQIWTFTKLYPEFLFPGSSQFSSAEPPQNLNIARRLHAYNPLQWWTVIQRIKKNPPKQIIFRYYTPFLAPCYGYIAKRLKSITSLCLLVDNWRPHESSLLDRQFIRYLKKNFDTYVTLSEAVAEELKSDNITNVGIGFHPIANDLPKPISKAKARRALGWPKNQKIALFYGLVRPYKGLDLLLKAMTIAPAAQQNIHLAIVGEFYEPLERYTTFIRDHKLKDRTYLFPKFADDHYTQQVFSAADIIVLPYRSASQSGVLALAYHFEKPILATHHPGLAKPIKNDETGWICQPNSKSLSIGLNSCFETEIEDRINNIQQAKDQYSWRNFVTWMKHFLENSHKLISKNKMK